MSPILGLNGDVHPNEVNLSKATTDESFEHERAYYTNITTHEYHTPANFREAMKSTHTKEWKQATDQEIASLLLNKTWTLVKKPKGANVIRTMFIFRLKVDAKGLIERFKARLVAKGYSQIWGIDYDETFVLVVLLENLRFLFALAVALDLEIHQMDVETAFLHALLSEEIYIAQPEGYIDNDHPDYVCKLQKSLYGLKQAPFEWNKMIHHHLLENNFEPLDADACIYIKRANGLTSIIALYVDDCTILAHKSLLQLTKNILVNKFRMKDLGEAKSVLGMELIRDRKNGKLFIRQNGRIQEILSCFGMKKSKPVATLMTVGFSLPKLDRTLDEHKHLPFRSAVGKLLYLARTGRPDILYAVHYLTHFGNGYGHEHWKGVKRILRYLQATVQLAICYDQRFYSPQDPSTLLPRISVDANFGPSNREDGKSLSAVVVRMLGGSVAWSVKTQQLIALSTTEAELNAISTGVCQALYMRKLFRPLGLRTDQPVEIVNDNQSAIALIYAKRGNYHGTKKHYDIKIKHAYDAIAQGLLTVSYCLTNELPADLLTKALARVRFNELKGRLNLVNLTSDN